MDTSQADRLFVIGSQSHEAGQFAAAEQYYREALKVAPSHLNSLYSLGLIGLQTGRHELAADMLEKAVALNSRDADWLCNLGLACERLGRLAEAADHYQRAVAINPAHVGAHNRLGIVMLQSGRTDEAMKLFKNALALDRHHIPTLMSVGNLYATTGQMAQAADVFEDIIRRQPNPMALENLALSSLMLGDPVRAIAALQQGIRIGVTPKLKDLFVMAAWDLRVTQPDPELSALILRALAENWGATSEFANLATSLICSRAEVRASMERATAAWPRRLPAADLFGPSGLRSLANDPLLGGVFGFTCVVDAHFERFLTAVRAALLGLAEASAPVDPDALRLLTVLARQSFLNEYVFAQTPVESEQASRLRDRLAVALQSGTQPPAHWVGAVGCYFALHSLPNAQSLLGFLWPETVTGLLQLQVREPLDEIAARNAIPQLTAIEDPVSQQVRAQYEESPYPRWLKRRQIAPSPSLDHHLQTMWPAAQPRPTGKGGHIDALIAGCGTGPAVSDIAQLFPTARILAIDLSRASLACSQRKSREAGHRNVEYAQADILHVGAIGRSFDLIESRGVLHHMGDPLAGWRALLSVLRPNGVMAIALYSEIAREHLVPARKLIAERGCGAAPEDIRRFRQDIIDRGATFSSILTSDDFFATSSCRDLLFHVHEGRFTLPLIDAFLEDNGLRLLGFELPPAVMHRYASRFPDDRSRTGLEFWEIFERENPETFRSMYQFWVQRED